MFTRDFLAADEGMSTVEYAIGLMAAATFALVLVALAKDESVMEALRDLVDRALSVP